MEGTSRREPLHIQEYDSEVILRPLTDGELGKVFGTIGSITMKDDGSPDVSNMDISKNLEALRIAATLGLVEPALTLDDVSKMKFGVPEVIGMKVLELSGVTFNEEDQRKKGES